MKPVDWHHVVFLGTAVITGFFVFLIVGFIFYTAAPVLAKEGLGFITGTEWSYHEHTYGIAIFLGGTLVLTAVTLALACPVGICTAVFLTEWAPVWLDRPVSTLIELLVGIPSIIFGIFGFFVLEKVFRFHIDPFISSTLGFIPFFYDSNPDSGTGVLLAATVLALMILPTIVTLSREAMRKVSNEYREASLTLGATKWETIKKVVLPVALPGILTAVILGMMRAMGETMAVVMLLGNAKKVPVSIFDQGYAMTSKILNDIGGYVIYDEPRSALFAIGAVLFALEFIFVAAIRFVSAHYQKRTG
ncbi:phosphate ABC transporter permease subunit PstC [Methanoculleus sp.]|uniref:phosphate ABC transporter permease subunit PstC n=1 Tax=Methanoculleus sp. TaxID=90427 RepID=UPI0025DDEF92|nr:phosphate ABC transporter permease subunit PstC [Methanoculleus sp.]